MTYQKEREHFIAAFVREFPSVDLYISRRLLHMATSEQRQNEIECSVPVTDRQQARMDARHKARKSRVEALAEFLGADVIWNGDPRGFPFLLTCPSGRTYDFGGRGLGVPGRGYTARELETMAEGARYL